MLLTFPRSSFFQSVQRADNRVAISIIHFNSPNKSFQQTEYRC